MKSVPRAATGHAGCALLLAAVIAALAPGSMASTLPASPAGESLYREGRLPSGEPLTATRGAGRAIAGAEAACINCHRRSGFGEIEGSIKIPPISGPYLAQGPAKDRSELRVPYVDAMHTDRAAYTDSSLERAIREGLRPDGTALSYLMPRYVLGEADMRALVGYLKSMTPFKAPGVVGSTVNFATIVTPDADGVKRKAMLDVLRQFFADQNAFALAQTPSTAQAQNLRSNAKRRWQLHVWELAGAPATWDAQLRLHLQQEPVYAVLTGLGGSEWGPIHRFCEATQLPCLFPNVEVPVVAESDFYSLYFSKGVLLEAALLAQRLVAGEAAGGPLRVVQVFRANDSGAAGAAALHEALRDTALPIVDQVIGGADTKSLALAIKMVRRSDALVLWLRPGDIAALQQTAVPTAAVFMSGVLGGLDDAPVPPAWRGPTQLTYPVDLPDRRAIRVDYAMGWLALHHIPIAAKQVQADTYVACSVLLETLMHMQGSFAPDYLVERLEAMLGHQLVSGYYPRLELAPHQRFASKGGYIVRFSGPTGNTVLPVTDWLVP